MTPPRPSHGHAPSPPPPTTLSETLRSLGDLLPARERWLLAGVFLASLIAAVFETLGVASILPFMTIVVDPSAPARFPVLRVVAEALGARTWHGTVILAAVGTGAMVALGNLASAWSRWLQLRFEARTRHRLASTLLRAFLHQPYAFHVARDAPSLLKVIEHDVGSVIGNILMPLLSVASRAFVVVALLGLLAAQSPLIAVTAVATLGGAYFVVFRLVRRRQSRLGEQAGRAAYEWRHSSHEAFGGVKDLIVLDRREAVSGRFADAYRRFVDAAAGGAMTATLPRFLLETIAFGCILALTVALLLRDEAGATVAIPTLTLYAFVAYRLMPGLQQLYAGAATLRHGAPALRTLHADWTDAGAGGSPPVAEREPTSLTFRESIALRGVTFTYPGAARPALLDIDLDIRRGESVGLIGRTGAGKSTLADILLGLFEPSAGTVTIDGVRLTRATTGAWRRRVGYVAQHIFLANASVSENIAFGLPPEDVDEAAVREAATLAHIDDFVATLPRGYATVVGERGVRFSGGERQRIGIARALYRRPDVLVFDEATSALDGLTEDAVMEAIRTLRGDRTVVLIAHRLRTLEGCDRLVLLDGGRAVATGTPTELAASSGAFARFSTRS